MPLETEIKFAVTDLDALRTRLHEIGFHEKTPPTFESNTLYDTPSLALRSSGQLLRIRRYGDRWILTHKAKGKGEQGHHKARRETETLIGDGEALHAIFVALGYAPVFRYEKYRAEWSDGEGHVVLDQTPIGNVAEIEGEAEWIDRTAAALGISRDAYILANYASLFREWKARTKSEAENMTFEECG